MFTHNSNINRRSIILVDIENQTGTPEPTLEQVRAAKAQLDALFGGQRLYEVACSHHAAAAVAFGFPGGRHRWRSGPDGADRALAEVVYTEGVAERFDEVVIASGDQFFVPVVQHLQAFGVHVVVASTGGRLAGRLRMVADEVVELDALQPSPSDDGVARPAAA